MTDSRAPQFIQSPSADPVDERVAAQAALLQPHASASPKFLYDRLGSHLFEAITELPEYYPTRTEAGIFAAHGADMARQIGTGATLIDLGAGNCAKAVSLFPLLEPSRYVAIDISVEFLRDALRHVQRERPQTEVVGLGMDFSRNLDIPPALLGDRPVFFYPGSSIGNFTPDEALVFLQRVREQAGGGGLLIGVDLVKADAILQAAYDDALGVTAAFNLNLLRHLNRLLDSDFEPTHWQHVALFNRAESRVEMHLQARHDLAVRWTDGTRLFAAGERIHTENSYKYTPQSFSDLLRQAGFEQTTRWSDPDDWFAVFWATAG